MIEVIVILTFLLLLAVAVALGESDLADKTAAVANSLRGELREAQREKETARGKAEMLLQYVKQDHEFRTFDSILKRLPADGYRGYPYQHRVMEMQRFDVAAHYFCTEPCPDEVSITALAFDAVPLRFQGKDYVGWKRGDWLLIPSKAMNP